MLTDLGLEFSGRQHSGLDDSRNIARIAAHLLESGDQMRVNERLLRRDRLEAAGKAASPERDGQNSQKAKEDSDVEEESSIFTLQVGREGKRKNVTAGRANGVVNNRQFRILPYKVLTISKEEFLRDAYEQCLTCDEGEEDEADA